MRLGKLNVLVAELDCPPAGPALHKVPEPSPAVNSWAARSTSLLLTEPEKLTVTVAVPELVMVPSHSSSSWEPSPYASNLVHPLALPPEMEETVTVEEETFTAMTKASPEL